MTSYTAPTINIVRTSDSTTFAIQSDMQWVERHSVVNIDQDLQHTIGGSAVLNHGIRLGGIPFTLQTREGVWLTKAQADALLVEARTNPTEKYTIDLPSGEVGLKLCWRYSDGLAVELEPVFDSRGLTDVVYTGALRFHNEI